MYYYRFEVQVVVAVVVVVVVVAVAWDTAKEATRARRPKQAKRTIKMRRLPKVVAASFYEGEAPSLASSRAPWSLDSARPSSSETKRKMSE